MIVIGQKVTIKHWKDVSDDIKTSEAFKNLKCAPSKFDKYAGKQMTISSLYKRGIRDKDRGPAYLIVEEKEYYWLEGDFYGLEEKLRMLDDETS